MYHKYIYIIYLSRSINHFKPQEYIKKKLTIGKHKGIYSHFYQKEVTGQMWQKLELRTRSGIRDTSTSKKWYFIELQGVHLILCFFWRFSSITDLSLFSLGVSVCTHTRHVEHQRCSRTGRVQKNHKT